MPAGDFMYFLLFEVRYLFRFHYVTNKAFLEIGGLTR